MFASLAGDLRAIIGIAFGASYDVIVLEKPRVLVPLVAMAGKFVMICAIPKLAWKMVWETQARARTLPESVDLVRALAKLPAINTPVHDGIVHADHKAAFVPETHAYIDYLKSRYDFHKLQPLSREAIRELVASDAYHGGMLDMGSGHINPLAFALGLARQTQETFKNKVRIFENSTVKQVEETDPAMIHTGQAQICARYVLFVVMGILMD